MPWSMRRKVLYSASGIILMLGIGAWVYASYFNTPPTCFDHTQNGGETGVDCGGPCALICPADAHAPTVMWSRVFSVASSTYTAAAYINNTNIGAGARHVRYTFQLFDANNALVGERDGVVDLPPVQTIPIVEPGIDTGYRKPARALFTFADVPQWQKIAADNIPSLAIEKETLSGDGTKLTATIVNNSYADAPHLTVAAVLFDGRDTALAASKSVIDVDKKSSSPVVFTWPSPVFGVTHAEVTVLPSF